MIRHVTTLGSKRGGALGRELRASMAGLIALGLALGPDRALADDDDKPSVDKSGYHLLNPVPDSALRSFSPDRPTKSTGPFTVDAGRTQLEMDFFYYTLQKQDGVRTTTLVGPNPNLKIGLTNNIDLQINMAPFMTLGVEDKVGGTHDRWSGQGDLFLRSKIAFWGNDGGKTAFALIPWLKAPTAATGLGNGATEGGVIAALQVSLPGDASLLFNSEVDWLKDATAGGTHGNYINAVGVTVPVIKDVSFSAELWSQVTDDPDGTVRQFSIDTALAWTVQPNLQLDIGANFGLNAATPQLQLYAGVARRF